MSDKPLIYGASDEPIRRQRQTVDHLENIAESVAHQNEQLDDIRTAVKAVETAVKDRPITRSAIVGAIVCLCLLSLISDIVHSKYPYAVWYGTSTDKVFINNRPHDCAFFTAPLGAKYCSYVRNVSTVRWATSQAGNPIISYDEGKTWEAFSPGPGVVVPKYSTVEGVYITWEKKED